MAIIGIDLGTTNSLACIWQEGGDAAGDQKSRGVLIPNAFGEFLTPSAVSVQPDGTISVGKTARERLISDPAATAASFKRFMGTEKEYVLSGRRFTAPELSSFVLRKLREDAERWLGDKATEAVVSVPAYFNDAQRAATKLAGELAGLRVERLVNEPSAAALACRTQAAGEDGGFLVFDFGGGTLDVSIVDCFENIVEIVAIAGNNRLGGDDFDLAIARLFCERNGLSFDALSPSERAIIISGACQCKNTLSGSPQSAMLIELPGLGGSLLLDEKLLAGISAHIFAGIRDAVERALRDSGRRPREIDRVIMVGGSCHMPLVKKYVSQLLNRPFAGLAAPDTTVALGVGVYAGIKARSGDIRDVLLTDVCPFTLGIGTHNIMEPEKTLMAPIIERNTTLPVSRIKSFCTLYDNQTEIEVRVYQGEAMYAEENILLGVLHITVPRAPAGQESIDVRFTYDLNGLLDVEVTVVSTGEKTSGEFVGKGYQLSEREIAQRRGALAALKLDPPGSEENRFLIARAERLYAELTGIAREELMERLRLFQQTLHSNRLAALQRERAAFSAFLGEYESGLYDLHGGYDDGGDGHGD